MYMLGHSYPSLGDPMDCSPPGSAIHGVVQARIIRVHCYFLFQGIFLTQGSNPSFQRLLHWQADSLPLSYWGSLHRHVCRSFPNSFPEHCISYWICWSMFMTRQWKKYLLLKDVCQHRVSTLEPCVCSHLDHSSPSLCFSHYVSCVLFHGLPLHLCGVVPPVASRPRLQGRYIKTWYAFIFLILLIIHLFIELWTSPVAQR